MNYIFNADTQIKEVKNYYDIFHISRGASDGEIKSAYIKLSKGFHPDLNANESWFTTAQTDINLGYEILSDPIKRREYDDKLFHIEYPEPRTRDNSTAGKYETTTSDSHKENEVEFNTEKDHEGTQGSHFKNFLLLVVELLKKYKSILFLFLGLLVCVIFYFKHQTTINGFIINLISYFVVVFCITIVMPERKKDMRFKEGIRLIPANIFSLRKWKQSVKISLLIALLVSIYQLFKN